MVETEMPPVFFPRHEGLGDVSSCSNDEMVERDGK